MTQKTLHGLNIARIFSMLGIIGLHLLNFGGAFNRNAFLSAHGIQMSSVYIIFMCSVNVFAMLTGYLYVDKPNVKYKNILKLLLTVVFYSVIITVAFLIFKRQVLYSTLNIIKSAVPLLFNKYWYVSCYTLLFVFIPFINKLINSLSAKQFRLLITLLIAVTSVLPTVLCRDFFGLGRGYTAAWLIICYILGAFIKRECTNISAKISAFGLLACFIIVMGVSLVGFVVLDNIRVYNILVQYTSPFILLMSVLFVILASKLQLKEGFITKVISALSSTAFDAYILHYHSLILAFFISGKFLFINNTTAALSIPIVLGSMIAIYLICWIISQVKVFIFKFTRIDTLMDKLGDWIDCLLKKNSEEQI